MNAMEAQAGYQPVREGTTLKTITGSAMMESLGAVATIALAIVGLAGVFSPTMAAIATIVLGAAIWIEGGGFAASHSEAFAGTRSESRVFAWSQGLGAEFIGGLCGIVLGILALLGVAPLTLLSVSALTFGATFLLSAGMGIGSGSQVVFGLAGAVLGLLAVVGLNSQILVLVALVCLGASALFNGASTSVRMAAALHSRQS